MKKFLMFMLMIACTIFSSFAEPVSITVLHTGDTVLGDTTLFTIAETMLKKDFPDVKITWAKIDLSDGSTLTMDAMLAAGTAPNLYIDSMVRASKYIIPEYALPLDKYIRDLSKYNPGALDAYKKGGKILAMPGPGAAQAMLVNLDMMKDIGYTVPKDWTINDFLTMAEKVKKFYGGKKYATGMFAANQSGDYLINAWFASFGVSFYKPGAGYDKSVIADTGGAQVYSFFQQLMKAGYIPASSATLTDDDYAVLWQSGNLAATAFFQDWTGPYFKSAITQKQIEKPFNYTFVPFPRASGVKKVPTYYTNGAMVVYNSGTAKDIVTARLVEYINSARIQGELAKLVSVIPNRSDAIYGPSNPHTQEIMAIVAANGLQDVGITDPRFTERRSLQFPILQQVLNLKITPEEAINLYQKKLSAVK